MGGGKVVGEWEGLYKMGLSESSCREDENTFLYPSREKIYIHWMFPKGLTLWLVAFPGFLIVSRFLGIVNVMCLVPAAACLLILGSLEAIIIARWAHCSPDY